MTNKELNLLLQSLGNESSFGAPSQDQIGRVFDRIASHTSFVPAPKVAAPSVWHSVWRLPAELTDFVARPLAFGSLLCVLVLGGWITSVNASLESIPGDALYGVKLASERAQLSLATSGTKAKLHGTFAARRVKEVEKLVQTQPDHSAHIQTALDGFSKQMGGVKDALDKSEDEQEIVELARIITEHANELEAVLDRPEAEPTAPRTALTEAVGETDQTKGAIVEVLVQKSDDSELSRQELSQRYQDELRSLQWRAQLLEDRIARLEAYAKGNADVNLGLNFSVLRFRQSDLDLAQSMNAAANGAWDEAFGILDAAKQQLRGLKDELIDVELSLVAPEEVAPEEADVAPTSEQEAPSDASADDAVSGE